MSGSKSVNREITAGCRARTCNINSGEHRRVISTSVHSTGCRGDPCGNLTESDPQRIHSTGFRGDLFGNPVKSDPQVYIVQGVKEIHVAILQNQINN